MFFEVGGEAVVWLERYTGEIAEELERYVERNSINNFFQIPEVPA